MEHSPWLQNALIYLTAAVVAVPLSRLLGLGSIIGYLGAGIAIGPWGFGWVTQAQEILHFAEFGVVLMLFLVGLELDPKRLWSLRKPIFGWGSVQLLGSTLVLAAIALLAGLDWRLALIGAIGLALSSTAIGLGMLNERNMTATPSGQGLLGVALFQDVAAIPVLALIPLLALSPAAGAASASSNGWWAALQALGVIVGIVLGGRLLVRPALRWIARSETPEIFTAAALLLVVATAALMQSVGLSMALGAFLAGVLLAESEYRKELETDLEPFKGLLLGLFFIAVGMSIDFAVVMQKPGWVALLLVTFLTFKALILWTMSRLMGLPLQERPIFIILLAQGGEFGFVVFQAATQANVLAPATSSLLIATIALSMLLTPLMLWLVDRFWIPRLERQSNPSTMQELNEKQNAPVIIAGLGRYGQVVARLLYANGLEPTVLDHDPEQIEAMRQFGWKAFYGDATRLDLLRMAGADKAGVMVIAIDDVQRSLLLTALVREHFPHLTLVARARNVQHFFALHELGVHLIERETLDAALRSGRQVLEALGWHPFEARTLAQRFRQHTVDQLLRMAPHHKDRSRLIASSKEAREQLEELFAEERRTKRQRFTDEGWHMPPPPTDSSSKDTPTS
jgi:glutathione-regulated potassium-efflux system ancillary protein KefC